MDLFTNPKRLFIPLDQISPCAAGLCQDKVKSLVFKGKIGNIVDFSVPCKAVAPDIPVLHKEIESACRRGAQIDDPAVGTDLIKFLTAVFSEDTDLVGVTAHNKSLLFSIGTGDLNSAEFRAAPSGIHPLCHIISCPQAFSVFCGEHTDLHIHLLGQLICLRIVKTFDYGCVCPGHHTQVVFIRIKEIQHQAFRLFHHGG